MVYFFTIFYLCLITVTCNLLGFKVWRKELQTSYIERKDNYEAFVDYLLAYKKVGVIPKYKFFSQIISELTKYQKRYGIDIKEPTREIRKAAQKNKKEETRVWEEFFGLVFQYSLIAGFTWIFITHVQIALGIKFAALQLGILACWQVFGGFVGIAIFYLSKIKFFKTYHSYFYSGYIFRSLIQISRPVSETIKVSEINSLKGTKSLKRIRDRFFYLVKGLKTQGHLPLEEFDNIIQELWDAYEDQFSRFHKLIMALKLFLIMVFVLPGFLFAIFLSMQNLLF